MSVVYRTSLKNTRMSAVVTDIGATGKLVIGTAGLGTVLSTNDLSSTAGTVSGGILTFNAISDATASAGTATNAVEAKITDGTNDIVTGLTVGAIGSGANIELSSVAITAGDTVSITSGTITHG